MPQKLSRAQQEAADKERTQASAQHTAAPQAAGETAHPLLNMQRSLGNQEVQRQINAPVQRKGSHGKKLYANCQGSYTNGTGGNVPFNEREVLLSNNVTTHWSKTDYEDMIKKALKKDGTIPRSVGDGQITITSYDTFTRK